MAHLKECPCGSGNFPEKVHDARGIFVSYVCTLCRSAVMSKYRPEIFTDPKYEYDGQIEPDEELVFE